MEQHQVLALRDPVTPALILKGLEGALRGLYQEPAPLLSVWQLQTHLISATTLSWKPI